MPKIILLILFFTAGLINPIHTQSEQRLKEINKTWQLFYKAFDSLDHHYMAKIHSKDLIRISGGKRIRDYDMYINGYQRTFQNARAANVSNAISLRFFERINNDSIASERGIYRLIRTDQKGDQQSYYGQFHVLFKKENNSWKILMDYDSTEGNTIGESAYLKAHAIDDLDRFIEK